MDAEIKPTDELASFIEDLHASEINGEIGWFFDGVWCVKIGDKHTAIKPKTPSCRWARLLNGSV